MKSRVEEFREYVPLVCTLFNPGMRDRHWLQVSDVVGFNLYPDDDMCLSHLIEMNLQAYVAKFEAISETASKEFSLEKALTKMKDEWEPVRFQVYIFKLVLTKKPFVLLIMAVHVLRPAGNWTSMC